jgi:hypothetical protein
MYGALLAGWSCSGDSRASFTREEEPDMSIPKDTKGAEPDEVEGHGLIKNRFDTDEVQDTSDDVEGHGLIKNRFDTDEVQDTSDDVEGPRLR